MADMGPILAGSSATCTLPGVGAKEKALLPAINALGVNVSWPSAPHRGSNEIPNPIALPQALWHHRVSSACWGGGGQAWPLASGQQGRAGWRPKLIRVACTWPGHRERRGTPGGKRGLSPCGGVRAGLLSSWAADANGPRQFYGPKCFVISACSDVFEKSFQSPHCWWNRKEGNN